jgi:hypothetical protein
MKLDAMDLCESIMCVAISYRFFLIILNVHGCVHVSGTEPVTLPHLLFSLPVGFRAASSKLVLCLGIAVMYLL